jgi:hypothetical protein
MAAQPSHAKKLARNLTEVDVATDEPVDEEIVDLDLKAEDARLREAVGEPTKIRIDGMVIHIDHIAEWSDVAMKASTRGDWETWADEVIADEKEADHFIQANLLNYQMEAVFETCSKAGGVGKGKSRRSRR